MHPSGTENDFRKIAEAMPQLVWTAAADGTVDYFNQGWVNYTGIAVSDLPLVQSVARVVHPDDAPIMIQRWNEAIRSGQPYEMEYRLRRGEDGSYRWFLARAVPVRDNGAVSHWIGTATDIDDQRRARESLEFVVEAGSLLSASLDEETICRELASIAVRDFSDWCFVTTILPDGSFDTRAIAHKNADLVHYVEQFRDKYSPSPSGPLSQVVGLNIPMLFSRITPQQIAESAQDEGHLKLLERLAMHSAMIVPLSADGQVFGALSLISAESGHSFDHKDLDVALAVAERAASAVQNARMYHQARRTSQRLRFAAQASQLLFESSDLDETFLSIAQLIVSEVADVCFIARIEGDSLRAVAAAHRDPDMNPLAEAFVGMRTMQPHAEKALIARLRVGDPIVREHLDLERLKAAGWPYLTPGIEAIKPASAIVVPLHTRNETFGAIFVYYAGSDSARAYDADDLPGLIEIAGRASIAIENADTLERERRIATTFQQASLPSLIPRPAGIHLNAVYSPAGSEAEVGGDWYDVIDLDDGSLVVSVGDVTGQGLQAAVVMSKVRHALGVLPRHESDPARILDSAGWFLQKRYPETIVTVFVGVISPDRKSFRYATAGHPYPILRRGGELIELKSEGLPLGLRSLDEPAQSVPVALRDGDLLALYTDGLIEASRNWAQGEACLRSVLKTDAIAHSIEPARLIEHACMEKNAHDDVAILTVLLGEGPEWSFKAEDARAAENARQELVEHLRSRGAAGLLIETAELIFGELIGNVVRHAPGPVEVELEWANGTPVLHVIDSGKPFSVPERLPDEFSESGRGLFIVHTIAGDLRVERVGNYGNHVRASLSPAMGYD